MEYTLVPLSALNNTQLTQLTALHQRVMHTLLAELGAAVVERYYREAAADPLCLGCFALSSSGEIHGWVVGSPDPAGLNAKLRQPISWFASRMFLLVFSRPRALWNLFTTLLSTSEANQLAKNQVELTYIGVSESARGAGLGGKLLNYFNQTARASGYNSTALSVETDNHAAIHLYLSKGFRIIKSFREGRFERHRMEFSLE
jgi:GNAT superfamily N-acetyltransferase